MDSQFDKDTAKEIGKALLLATLITTISHLISWGFEHIKSKYKSVHKKDKNSEPGVRESSGMNSDRKKMMVPFRRSVDMSDKKHHPGYGVWNDDDKCWVTETISGEVSLGSQSAPTPLTHYHATEVSSDYRWGRSKISCDDLMVCALDRPGVRTVVRTERGWVSVEKDPKIEVPWYDQPKHPGAKS